MIYTDAGISARIRERKARIIEHRWRGCSVIRRGRFISVRVEAARRTMLDDEPLHAIFLPFKKETPLLFEPPS